MTVDVSERVAVTQELGHREEILRAVTTAAERLMRAASWTELAQDILSALGEAAHVSRVYVFQNRATTDRKLVADQRAEWVAEGVTPQMDNDLLQGFDYAVEGYGPWAERMRAGEAVQARRDHLQGRPRELFDEQDIRALLLVPVFTDTGWWGFIGFDDCVNDRTFPSVEVEALRAAAGIFGAAIGRERAQEALAEVEMRFRALVEQLPAVTHISGLDRSASTLYISPQVEQMLGYGPNEWLADPDLWVKLLHEDDRDAAVVRNEEFIRTGEPFLMEYRMRARDGRVVWIRDESVMIRDATGRPVEMQGIMLDVTDARRAKEELQRSLALLERSDAERRDLLAHLVHAQEQERVRIASDIHDDPLQKLTAVGMRLAGLRRELGDQGSEAMLQLERTLSGAISSLRSLLFEVRPPSLDREGLATAVSQYLRETCREGELGWEVDDRLVTEPPAEVRAICYRIAQEALTNVRKHARASTVRVELSCSDDGVRVRVLDDGVGIDPDASAPSAGHLGIPSMRERAELAGGHLRIAPRPEGGTSVEFWLPTSPPSGVGPGPAVP